MFYGEGERPASGETPESVTEQCPAWNRRFADTAVPGLSRESFLPPRGPARGWKRLLPATASDLKNAPRRRASPRPAESLRGEVWTGSEDAAPEETERVRRRGRPSTVITVDGAARWLHDLGEEHRDRQGSVHDDSLLSCRERVKGFVRIVRTSVPLQHQLWGNDMVSGRRRRVVADLRALCASFPCNCAPRLARARDRGLASRLLVQKTRLTRLSRSTKGGVTWCT